MKPIRRGSATAAQVSTALLAIAVVVAPLGVGGVHPATACLISAVCLLAWGSWCGRSLREGTRCAVPFLAMVLLVVLAWELVSILPLPLAVVEGLSHGLGEVLDDSVLEGVAVPCLSYTPGATTLEIVESCGAVAALLLAAQLAHLYGRRLVLMVALSATVVFGVSILQTVTRTETLLGVYQPLVGGQQTVPTPFGFRTTFVNANHAAQFFELAALAALTMGALGRPPHRGYWAIAGAIGLVAIALTGSTGGMVCAGAGLCLLGTLWLARTKRRWLRPVVPCLVGLIVVATLGAATWASLAERGMPGVEAVDERLVSKTEVWPDAVTLVGNHALVGVGRGSFRDAIPRFQGTVTARSKTYVENEYLQVLAELGVGVGGLLIAVVIGTWLVALMRWKGGPVTASALVATFAVGVHNLAGFGLEFAGVGLPFVVLMGILAADAWAPTVRERGRRSVRVALGLVPTVGLFFVPLAVAHGDYHDSVNAIMDASTPQERQPVVDPRLRWRPASADVAFAIAGYHARCADPSSSLRWLGRTMYLAPAEPRPHELAAWTLAEVGRRDQALLEIRLAMGLTRGKASSLYALLFDLSVDRAEAQRVLAGDPERTAEFVTFVIRRDRKSVVARELQAALWAEHPGRPSVVRAAAEVAVADGNLDTAVAALRSSLADNPHDISTICLLSRTLSRRGDEEDARQAITEALDARPDHPKLLLEAARVEMDGGHWNRARRYLRLAHTATPPHVHSTLAEGHRLEAELLRATGDLPASRDAYRQVLLLYPRRHAVRVELARLYMEMGKPDVALKELHRVRRETRNYPRVERLISEIEGTMGAVSPGS